jgi:hypothetical protein
MKKLLLATTLLAGLMSSAQAVELNGNVLLQQCSRDPTNFCQGYVLGLASGTGACPGLSGFELVGVVQQYLRQRPDRRHLSGQEVVREAYASAPACKKQLTEKARPAPTPSPSDDSVFAGATEDDVIVAFGTAAVVAYANCGGKITAEQQEAIEEYITKNAALMAPFTRQMKSKSCSDITKLYHGLRTQLSPRS